MVLIGNKVLFPSECIILKVNYCKCESGEAKNNSLQITRNIIRSYIQLNTNNTNLRPVSVHIFVLSHRKNTVNRS